MNCCKSLSMTKLQSFHKIYIAPITIYQKYVFNSFNVWKFADVLKLLAPYNLDVLAVKNQTK